MIERKRRGRLVSARREVAEQNRIRNSYERRLSRQLSILFESIAETTVREYQVGGSPTVRLENVTNRISEVLVPHYRSVILAMADRFQTVKVKQDYEQVVRNYLRFTATDRIVGISTTTQNLIKRALLEADQETNPRQAAKLIEERVGGAFGRRRAVTIARTETHAAASYANHEVAKDLGVPMRKQWVATNDDRSRTWHSSVNGQTVDLDEDFIVPYKGVEYRMKHTGDPNGGAHNTINCRCVTIYLEPEDVVVDDQPKPPEAAPIVARNPWDSAFNPDVNDQSISIIPAAQALRQMKNRVAESAKDDRYLADTGPRAGKPISMYSSTTVDDFGDVKLAGISDEGASVLSAIMPELDDIADRCGVPRLRGFKETRGGSAIASMGDAVMKWAVKRLNADTKPIKSQFSEEAYAKSKKRIDDYEKELQTRQQNLGDLRGERLAADFRYREDPTNDSLRQRLQELQDAFDKETIAVIEFSKASRIKLIDDYNTVNSSKKINASSTWKVGDDLAERPWTTDAYFEGVVNKVRTTAYHELGHHIHQMWNPKFKGYSGTGKIEQGYLKGTWRHKASSPSRYGTENKKEWFAENFSLFWMGRRDLVAPRFMEIMEEVLDVEIPR
jgi:hypothetical protein